MGLRMRRKPVLQACGSVSGPAPYLLVCYTTLVGGLRLFGSCGASGLANGWQNAVTIATMRGHHAAATTAATGRRTTKIH